MEASGDAVSRVFFSSAGPLLNATFAWEARTDQARSGASPPMNKTRLEYREQFDEHFGAPQLTRERSRMAVGVKGSATLLRSGFLLSLLVVLLLLLRDATSASSKTTSIPRLKLTYKDLQASNSSVTLRDLNSSDHRTLLLDEERGRLFVGGQDVLYSLALDNITRGHTKISWPASDEKMLECQLAGKDVTKDCGNHVRVLHHYNQTHLYTCGTGAFNPVCAFLRVGRRSQDQQFSLERHSLESGRGKSPYDPNQLTASTLVGEELYAGVTSDFMGRDFAIVRTLGRRMPVRTEQHDSRWLSEPKFIAAHRVPESNGYEDDDKVYFFFRETAMESEHPGKAVYSRIGQVCRNDVGGQKSLINKWTTFLKARLVCSVPGPDGIDTYFDELQDVYLLQTRDAKNPVIYTIFTTTSSVFKGSAVCMYSMADVRRTFLGPFAHKEGPSHKWVAYQGRVPYPRPGTCPSRIFGGFESTRAFPDEVVSFVKSHPLMLHPVRPAAQRPLLLQTDVGYRFTQIVVDRVEADDGHYDVMFIATDVGTVLKVVSVPRQTWQDLEEVLLEEIQVFKEPEPILSMEISSKLQYLYIGSSGGLTQLALHRCGVYGEACAECCLARDPYCAWDGASCTRYFPSSRRRSRRQDVRNGDPLTQCSDQYYSLAGDAESMEEQLVYGVENSSLLLECLPKSQQAHVSWLLGKLSGQSAKNEVTLDDRVAKTAHGLLFRGTLRGDTGSYLCRASEHGFAQTLRRFRLEVIDAAQLEELLQKEDEAMSRARIAQATEGAGPSPPPPPPSLPGAAPQGQLWYRDFMQLINHPTLGGVDDFCEQVWHRERRHHRGRQGKGRHHGGFGHAKWKHLQDGKKGRSRRTHEPERSPRSVRP
ncbi:semaphorin-3A-like isoform X2 [Petromyzon marinus]|uniref:semaphorin-3A-like isoform X2 n=1 Tax=Petromyzon marinus TaxID=7757 RepID=UPI003F6EBBE6